MSHSAQEQAKKLEMLGSAKQVGKKEATVTSSLKVEDKLVANGDTLIQAVEEKKLVR